MARIDRINRMGLLLSVLSIEAGLFYVFPFPLLFVRMLYEGFLLRSERDGVRDMNHKERARQLIQQQYHCAQALFGAFADEVGMDLKTALKISSCFGGGMRQGDVCGCISAALMVLGMALGTYDPQDKERDISCIKKTEEYIRIFKDKMGGAVCCREILGKDLSIMDEMAEIHSQNLMQQICPGVLDTSIDILEQMLDGYIDADEDQDIGTDEIMENGEMQAVLKNIRRFRRFRKNVGELLLSSREKIGFIQFDIRRFKIINDLYGEKIGDEILDFIKAQLSEVCSKQQYFINLRSDVFMIVTEYAEEEELVELIQKLDSRVSCYKAVKLQMSYGVYTVEDRQMELRQMEDRAAMARKAVKNNGVSHILFYKDQFKESLYNRKFIEENMQAAITERQFMMYLQPKYSITKNEIVGAEALVRWKHPERGMIYPDQFIPIIEENGFIREVDYYIWEEACRFIKKCEKAGITNCPISVNVSRVHLRDDECIGVLSELIRRCEIPQEMLELEITESVDDQQMSQKAYQLKEEGYTLLMDDFGSGYSSLNILLETPFDVIKLDKKFIENMMVSTKGRMILEQVVAMSNKLGLGLLAEGVETKEQVDVLRGIGCDHVQGYYYAKPMPKEDVFELLKKQFAQKKA